MLKIGFNKHGGLGDGIVATAAVAGIREKFPEARVTGHLLGSVKEVFRGFDGIRIEEAFYHETPGLLKENQIRENARDWDIFYDMKPVPRFFFREEYQHLETDKNREWKEKLNDLNTIYPDSIRELEQFGLRQCTLIAEALDIPLKKPSWKYQRTFPKQEYVTLCNEAWGEAKTKTYPFWEEIIPYVGYPVIQVGESRGETIKGAVNRTGELSLAESCRLVTGAVFHLGIEGFWNHFCETADTPRCVFFGPTSEIFFGYDDAINIKNEDCNCLNCQWLSGDWMHNCPRGYGYEKRPCVQGLEQKFIDAVGVLNKV